MKKGNIILIVVVAIVAILALSVITTYNNLVGLNENVDKEVSNIDTQLQRRNDLIPNLISTVKGYMEHEENIINAVTDARTQLSGAKTIAEKAKANNELTNALNGLLVVVEAYPDLKANTQFTALMDELAGTENRISVARKDYNEVVRTYNTAIKKFPKNMIASIFNFTQKDYFDASEGAENVPQVNFD